MRRFTIQLCPQRVGVILRAASLAGASRPQAARSTYTRGHAASRRSPVSMVTTPSSSALELGRFDENNIDLVKG